MSFRRLATTCFGGLLVLGACSSSSVVDDQTARRSNELTTEGVDLLLAGSGSLADARDKLASALVFKSDNIDARVFLAIATALSALDEELQPGTATSDLLNRSGVQVVRGATFWDTSLTLEAHGQGLFKDGMPTLDEFELLLQGTFVPILNALADGLETVPSDWEYVVPASSGGRLLELLSPGGSHSLRFDYADTQALAAVGHGVLAVLEAFSFLDWNGLSPDELDLFGDPAIDVWNVLVAQHPTFGSIANLQQLIRARDQIRSTFHAYERTRDKLRNESATQEAEGILTLGRDTFDTPEQRTAFLADEDNVHAWLDGMVGAMFGTETFTITSWPDGSPLDAAMTVGLDFAAFFAGVDPRAIYLKTVADPLTAKLALGVSDVAELTAEMASIGNTITSFGGDAPDPGALQEFPGYGLRRDVAQVPQSTKSIDGVFTDWAADSVRVMLRAANVLGSTRPDLGQLFAARDAGQLYLFLDEDLTRHLTLASDRYSIRVEWDGGIEQRVEFGNLTHSASGGATFTHASGVDGGIECAFPIVGDFAKIVVTVEADHAGKPFVSERGPVILGAR